jgi:hypothetical protein
LRDMMIQSKMGLCSEAMGFKVLGLPYLDGAQEPTIEEIQSVHCLAKKLR